MKRFIFAFAAVMNMVLIDAVVKEVAVGYLKGASAICVIPNFFNLAYVENRGCAWGMFQGQVWPLAVFGGIAIIVLIWQRKNIFGEGKLSLATQILMYAGILGNLIDRVFRGYVIDMFDFYWGVHHFPCFNLADSYICIAAALLILCSSVKRSC